MIRIFKYLRDRHAVIFKGFLFVLAVIVIVYFQPKQVRFKYELSNIIGKPWHYESLIAPFEYPILKTKEEISAEQEKIEREALPYYRFDSLRLLRQISAIDSVLGGKGKPDPATFFNQEQTDPRKIILGNYWLAARKGIISERSENGVQSVYVIRGNVAQTQDLLELVTDDEADSLIKKSIAGFENVFSPQQLDNVYNLVSPTLVYDSVTTRKAMQEAIKLIVTSRGIKAKDQLIISRGEPVDSVKFQELVSFKVAFEEQAGKLSGTLFIAAGQAILVSLCLLVFFLFLSLFRAEVLQSDVKVVFMLLQIILTVLLSYVALYFENIPLAALPFCILPIVMRAFFDTRLALFAHIITTLIIGQAAATDRFEFVFIQLIAGIGAIFSIVSLRTRSQIFFSAGVIFLAYMLSHLGLTIVEEGALAREGWMDFVYFGISAGLSLVAYPLIFLFEKTFGFTSDVTLLELSDTNSPLLRELAEKAPGTFQHSLQVANLSEEAIRRIGGNALLVRTGALYHDVGKSEMPMYFIENQTTGVNPHDELSFEESATLIISHVITGVEKARAAKLPDSVIDFIRTHHGTTNTAYFLRLYKLRNPGKDIDEELFRYPGPIPFSKETAVLMMADAVEASSRSLKKYDAESIEDLINTIIDSQIEQEQFINSDITLKDITTIKKIFRRKLMSIYHVRVEYPR